MTVPVSERIAGPYSCNGSLVDFDFAFKVFTETDVRVILTDEDGVETDISSACTVTLNADQQNHPGGTITTASAYDTGNRITMDGSLGYAQLTELTNLGGFFPKVVEAAFDRCVIMSQQLKKLIDRCVKINVSALGGAASEATGFGAGKYLRVTLSGLALEFVDTIVSTGEYLASGLGAVTRTVLAKLADLPSVKDYGAVGDGVIDDTAAFQAAILANKCVFMPIGDYVISDNIEIPEGRDIRGCGDLTRIHSTADICFKLGTQAASLSYRPGLRDVTIFQTPGGIGVQFYGTRSANCSNVQVYGDGATTIGFQFNGANISCFFNTLVNCDAFQCLHGYQWTGGSEAATIQYLFGCSAFDCTVGMYFDDLHGIDTVIYGGNLESCVRGIHSPGSTYGVTVDGVRYEANTTADIELGTLTADWTICNNKNLTVVVAPVGSGYGRHKFVNNYPFADKIEKAVTHYAPTAATVPRKMIAAPAQTANLDEWYDSAENLIAAVSAGGLLNALSGLSISGTRLFVVSGVPDNAAGSNNDFLLRKDGTAAAKTLFYHKEGGVWVAIVP